MGVVDLLGNIISSIKFLNSLLENTIYNRTVICNKPTEQERGAIHLKVRKGILSVPRKLPFKIPPHAKIIEDENYELISYKIDNKRGVVPCINCSDIELNQEVHYFQFRYTRTIDGQFISKYIECVEMDASDGRKVTVKNNSDIEFINYLVKCRVSLPRYIILDFENLEKMPKEIIKVNDNTGEKIESFISNIFMKGEIGNSLVINLYGDVCWYIDLDPNEKKIFKLCNSETKKQQC